MSEKIINYTNADVYSDLLDCKVKLEIQQIIQNGENICMVTHDSLNRLANKHNVKYDYALRACSMEHAVVECRASFNAKNADVILREVIGIGETVTSALDGLSKTIPTQMAYKRAFDAAILNLFGFPAKMYSEIQLGKQETIIPDKIENQPVSEDVPVSPAPVETVVKTVAETVDDNNMFDIEVPASSVTAMQNDINDEGPALDTAEKINKKEAMANTPILFSKALDGSRFKDVKPTKEWLEWLNKETTKTLMQSRSKEIYDNFMAFRNYIAG